MAFGSKPFIEKIKENLALKATCRKIILICADDTFELRERDKAIWRRL